MKIYKIPVYINEQIPASQHGYESSIDRLETFRNWVKDKDSRYHNPELVEFLTDEIARLRADDHKAFNLYWKQREQNEQEQKLREFAVLEQTLNIRLEKIADPDDRKDADRIVNKLRNVPKNSTLYVELMAQLELIFSYHDYYVKQNN